MTATRIQEQISIDVIYEILNDLGAEPQLDKRDGIITAKTICHGGDSHKLYYYDNSKRFTCFTGDCGFGFSIFDLLQKVKGIGFKESYNIITQNLDVEIQYNKRKADVSFFEKFKKGSSRNSKLKEYDSRVLNLFHRYYHIDWVKDNITTRAMRKYQILFNIVDNQIIIPHYDIKNRLVGIRVRNLTKEVIDNGMKYMPLIFEGENYKHKTGDNLYGLNFTIENIKKHKRVILFESEKSCMQLEGYLPEGDNISVALSGSNLSDEQVKILNKVGTGLEVVIALDKEFDEIHDGKDHIYAQKIKKNIINKLLPYYKVSVIWDTKGYLDKKDSPTDKGKEVFLKLFQDRIII